MIPKSSQYPNVHLVPTLMGQGAGYPLARSSGLAASRIQSARRALPKDDLFFREFLFAKWWEQGLQQRYGEMLLGEELEPLHDRFEAEYGSGWE